MAILREKFCLWPMCRASDTLPLGDNCANTNKYTRLLLAQKCSSETLVSDNMYTPVMLLSFVIISSLNNNLMNFKLRSSIIVKF